MIVNTPINNPPNTRLSHPSEIYPGLALKLAQTNDGIMPKNNEIINSSIKILDLSDELGNCGAEFSKVVLLLLTSRK